MTWEYGGGGSGGGGAGSDTTAIHDNVDGEIAAIAEKASPVNGDVVIIEDSAASNAKKRAQVGNLPGGTSDHGALSGLSDRDHNQYDIQNEDITVTGSTFTIAPTNANASRLLIVQLTAQTSSHTLTSTPTIDETNLQTLQFLWLYCNDSNGRYVEIQDESVLSGSKLRLGASTRKLYRGDSVLLRVLGGSAVDMVEFAYHSPLPF